MIGPEEPKEGEASARAVHSQTAGESGVYCMNGRIMVGGWRAMQEKMRRPEHENEGQFRLPES